MQMSSISRSSPLEESRTTRMLQWLPSSYQLPVAYSFSVSFPAFAAVLFPWCGWFACGLSLPDCVGVPLQGLALCGLHRVVRPLRRSGSSDRPPPSAIPVSLTGLQIRVTPYLSTLSPDVYIIGEPLQSSKGTEGPSGRLGGDEGGIGRGSNGSTQVSCAFTPF